MLRRVFLNHLDLIFWHGSGIHIQKYRAHRRLLHAGSTEISTFVANAIIHAQENEWDAYHALHVA